MSRRRFLRFIFVGVGHLVADRHPFFALVSRQSPPNDILARSVRGPALAMTRVPQTRTDKGVTSAKRKIAYVPRGDGSAVSHSRERLRFREGVPEPSRVSRIRYVTWRKMERRAVSVAKDMGHFVPRPSAVQYIRMCGVARAFPLGPQLDCSVLGMSMRLLIFANCISNSGSRDNWHFKAGEP